LELIPVYNILYVEGKFIIVLVFLYIYGTDL